jgi:hypothetical protein
VLEVRLEVAPALLEEVFVEPPAEAPTEPSLRRKLKDHPAPELRVGAQRLVEVHKRGEASADDEADIGALQDLHEVLGVRVEGATNDREGRNEGAARGGGRPRWGPGACAAAGT